MSESNVQMSSGERRATSECNKNSETFAEIIVDDQNLEKNKERKIGGNGNNPDIQSDVCSNNVISDSLKLEGPQVVVSNADESDDNKLGKHNLLKSGSENSLVKSDGKSVGITLSPGVDFRPPRNNVETGYLIKNPKSNLKSSQDDSKKMQEKKEEFGPGHGVKMSSMEEEAMRERLRMTLLKQCSDYLSADGSSRYTKETFRRVFTEKVKF